MISKETTGVIAIISLGVALAIALFLNSSLKATIKSQQETIENFEEVISLVVDKSKKPTPQNLYNALQPLAEAKSLTAYNRTWNIRSIGKSSILISNKTGYNKIIPMPNGRLRSDYEKIRKGDSGKFKYQSKELLFVPFTNFLYFEKFNESASGN